MVAAYDAGNTSELLRLAQAGGLEAQYRLGLAYATGQGAQQNLAEAAFWYRKAAEGGHREAQFQLHLVLLHGGTKRGGANAGWYAAAAPGAPARADALSAALFPNGLAISEDPEEALRWGLAAASAGHVAAQASVARMLADGRGCPPDRQAARRWYEAAAEGADPDAEFALGVIYANGLDVPIDFERAASWYKRAVRQGNVRAMTALGLLYQTGQGVERDLEQAAGLFRIAGRKGDPRANYHLALLHLSGEGVAADLDQAKSYLELAAMHQYLPAVLVLARHNRAEGRTGVAITWVRPAAEAGNPEAQCLLGSLLLESGRANLEEALSWLGMAAEKGHIQAQVLMAKALRDVPTQRDSAVALLSKAAAAGSAEAKFMLAGEHLKGERLDYDKADQALRESAEMGHVPAMMRLGHLYSEERAGVDIDGHRKQAAHWFQAAADAGSPDAGFILGWLYLDGKGVEQSDERAVEHFVLAADRGNVRAAFQLGAMCASGQGTRRNPKQAVYWYRIAAAGGERRAQYNLASMLARGDGCVQDIEEAVNWYEAAAANGLPEARSALARLQRSQEMSTAGLPGAQVSISEISVHDRGS